MSVFFNCEARTMWAKFLLVILISSSHSWNERVATIYKEKHQQMISIKTQQCRDCRPQPAKGPSLPTYPLPGAQELAYSFFFFFFLLKLVWAWGLRRGWGGRETECISETEMIRDSRDKQSLDSGDGNWQAGFLLETNNGQGTVALILYFPV